MASNARKIKPIQPMGNAISIELRHHGWLLNGPRASPCCLARPSNLGVEIRLRKAEIKPMTITVYFPFTPISLLQNVVCLRFPKQVYALTEIGNVAVA